VPGAAIYHWCTSVATPGRGHGFGNHPDSPLAMMCHDAGFSIGKIRRFGVAAA
jgi:hypothetical protein